MHATLIKSVLKVGAERNVTAENSAGLINVSQVYTACDSGACAIAVLVIGTPFPLNLDFSPTKEITEIRAVCSERKSHRTQGHLLDNFYLRERTREANRSIRPRHVIAGDIKFSRPTGSNHLILRHGLYSILNLQLTKSSGLFGASVIDLTLPLLLPAVLPLSN
ncbi:hypothetical protein J6590_028250 [Homalodisca vitripennis]|nr:hypothetical protein J6590_028250 [Homalodisca vitripennis]